MSIQTVTFGESTSRSRSQTVTIPNLFQVNSVTVNTGSATYSVSGNSVTVNVSSGTAVRSDSYNYRNSYSVSDSRTGGTGTSFPSTVSVSYSDASGSIGKSGSAYVISGSEGSTDSKSHTTFGTATKYFYWEWDGYFWDRTGDSISPSSKSVTTLDGYSGSLPLISWDGTSPSVPSAGSYVGQTATTSRSGTGTYSGTVTKTTADTRTWQQDYSGTIYSPYYSGSTNYYAYTATIDYTLNTVPTPSSFITPSSGSTVSTTPYTVSWTQSVDEQGQPISYVVELSLNGGSTWTQKYSGAATSFSYDFLQHPDTTGAKLRIRSSDGSLYSDYSSVTFNISHKVKIGTYKAETSTGTVSLPIYDPTIGMDNKNALRIMTSNGIGCFELVEITDTLASPFRVNTSQGIKAISKT